MKLAVIVPYRDRAEHLRAFLPAMHAHLGETAHHVFIVEQLYAQRFNRGKLLNVGFALRSIGVEFLHPHLKFSHVVLHDVDMLPQEVEYAPVSRPTHLAGAASQFNHALPYPEYFGGVTLFPVFDFERINGYNNDYWGWGCEDDDLLDRCTHHGLAVDRVAGRFESLPHVPSLSDPKVSAGYTANWERLKRNRADGPEYASNGLNSLTFHVQEVEQPERWYTHVKVEL